MWHDWHHVSYSPLPSASAAHRPTYGFWPVSWKRATAGVTTSPGRGATSSGVPNAMWRKATAAARAPWRERVR